MPCLDNTIPYQELIMAYTANQIPWIPSLPDGYTLIHDLRPYKSQWCDLMLSLQFPFSYEESQKIFEKLEMENPVLFAQNFLGVLDPSNHLVATAGLWTVQNMPGDWRIHWVMTDLNHQRLHLARFLVATLIHRFAQLNHGSLYLSTQASSWPAILLYHSLGFTPCLQETSWQTTEEAKAAWNQAGIAIEKASGNPLPFSI